MAEWIYFLHPPRDDFAVSMSDDERAVFAAHRAYLEELMTQGSLLIAGPTGGTVNTGVTVLEAPDESSARAIMSSKALRKTSARRRGAVAAQAGSARWAASTAANPSSTLADATEAMASSFAGSSTSISAPSDAARHAPSI